MVDENKQTTKIDLQKLVDSVDIPIDQIRKQARSIQESEDFFTEHKEEDELAALSSLPNVHDTMGGDLKEIMQELNITDHDSEQPS